ncbi:hypothetical protein QJQ45_002263 [Haematococcus lacustris]|nr:hypothetical protein QJQ45_002263 [Haematococcus lacustris]
MTSRWTTGRGVLGASWVQALGVPFGSAIALWSECPLGVRDGPVPRSKSRFRLKARENKSDKVRAAHIATARAQHPGPSQGPARAQPGPSTPLPAKRTKRTKAEPEAAEPTKGKGKAAKAKPAPQPGRWLDRDCNAALNMQRIGESRWRPLELCYWPDQGALPAKGKEYPGLGYKRL